MEKILNSISEKLNTVISVTDQTTTLGDALLFGSLVVVLISGIILITNRIHKNS